jgi:predicted DNA-binding transcriptional regulator AlpA
VAPIREAEVFAMTDQLMSRAEIVRRLRLVTSQRCRHRPLTMAAIAVRCGLSRMTVYRALNGDMADLVVHLPSQVLVVVPVQEMIEAAAGFGLAQRPG